jgi:hypothetical protein
VIISLLNGLALSVNLKPVVDIFLVIVDAFLQEENVSDSPDVYEFPA